MEGHVIRNLHRLTGTGVAWHLFRNISSGRPGTGGRLMRAPHGFETLLTRRERKRIKARSRRAHIRLAAPSRGFHPQTAWIEDFAGGKISPARDLANHWSDPGLCHALACGDFDGTLNGLPLHRPSRYAAPASPVLAASCGSRHNFNTSASPNILAGVPAIRRLSGAQRHLPKV